MTDERRDGATLGPLRGRMAAASWAEATLMAGEPRAQIGLRARGEARARAAAALNLPALPAVNRVAASPRGDCFGLGPDEWLLAGAPASRAESLKTLEEAVGSAEGAVVDLSASRVILELRGELARDVLASCCALDLHPSTFGPGQCAQTLLAKAPVLVCPMGATSAFRLFVRPSLAAYVVSWLVDGLEGVRAEASAG